MRATHPQVYGPVSRPDVNWRELQRYLSNLDDALGFGRDGAMENWLLPRGADKRFHFGNTRQLGELLVEFMGRLCYRSWSPGMNPNVFRVRENPAAYLENILKSGHGSVLEHANYSFVFADVSRVFTHELVRHRAGTAISQESMRFVRLTDIPFEMPKFVQEDPVLLEEALALIASMESFQVICAERTGINDPEVPFAKKKAITSGMRRFAPEGVATTIGWSGNVRTLRHVIETRTAAGVEDEIRRVFYEVGLIMKREAPLLFSDFEETLVEGEETPALVPKYKKV